MIDLGVRVDETGSWSGNRQGLHPTRLKMALLGSLALSLAATGCAQPEAPAASENASNPESAAFPDFAPHYPGAAIIKQESQKTVGDSIGTMVVLETPDSIAKVIGFYDAHAKRTGLKAELAVDEEDSAIRIFESGGMDAKGGMISVSPANDGKSSSIVITAGQSAIAAIERQAIRKVAGPQPADPATTEGK